MHTCRYADVMLCRCDVLHMEVKTLDLDGGYVKFAHGYAHSKRLCHKDGNLCYDCIPKPEYAREKSGKGFANSQPLHQNLSSFSPAQCVSISRHASIALTKTSPRSDTIVILCEHLKITSDYLLGLRNRAENSASKAVKKTEHTFYQLS